MVARSGRERGPVGSGLRPAAKEAKHSAPTTVTPGPPVVVLRENEEEIE